MSKSTSPLEQRIAALELELRTIRAAAPDTIKNLSQAKAALGDALLRIQALTDERNGFKAKLEQSNILVDRLEKLCRVKGLSPSAAVPNLDDPSAGGNLTADDYEQRLRNAKTPEERGAITKEFEAAAREGRVLLR